MEKRRKDMKKQRPGMGKKRPGIEKTWQGGEGRRSDVGRYQPDIEGVRRRVGKIFAPMAPFSKGRWFGMMWPWMLAAAVLGVTFELAKCGILELRRHIYNHNRSRKYAKEGRSLAGTEGGSLAKVRARNSKRHRKNQAWRTTPHGRGRGGYRGSCRELLPLPPDFVENLSRQWDRVRDSSEEALKFGDMLVELEDYVDNSFIFNGEDEIVGRNPGIKGFLEEHCGHIVYKTAMRYRTLALKAKEVSREQGKLREISKGCDTVGELSGRLDEVLEVEHRKVKAGQRRQRRLASEKSPQSAIFSLREQAFSTLGRLNGSERARFAAALRDLAHELLA